MHVTPRQLYKWLMHWLMLVIVNALYLQRTDQLRNIWNPTNPYLAKNFENGYWTTNDTGLDMRSLVGKKIRVAMLNVRTN